MPLYFAYGSNMDAAAMAKRCPNSRPLGRVRLARHRFFIMADGFASIVRDGKGEVHGVLYQLALSDIGPLDRYEEVHSGLYVKITQPVLRAGGGSAQALVYVGCNGQEGSASRSYMETILGAARSWSLPPAYIALLKTQTKSSPPVRGA